MGKYRVFRAIFIRIVFVIHSFLAIWQLVQMKDDNWFWYLSFPLFFLVFETVITLSVRRNLEWSWFCPSVFLYLASIVPAIWLLELDKVERRMKVMEELPLNLTTGAQLKEFNTIIGVQIKLPDIPISTETWITLIEQFLMLILIIGRWMLPKGDLTRDQLSQLLLVYIGTAADIIEFFDSFKDDKIAAEPVLVLLTLAIWSWSLMQFTVVLTATKSRKSRLTTTGPTINKSDNCCTIDVCSIILNITLQDFPFLAFRLLLITHYNIISYMNVFFTCKNTLVILLQIYRLYVVYTERNKKNSVSDDIEVQSNISIISRDDLTYVPRRKRPSARNYNESYRKPQKNRRIVEELEQSSDSEGSGLGNSRQNRKTKNSRKDTGYSTASSYASSRNNVDRHQSRRSDKELSRSRESLEPESRRMVKQKLKRSDNDTRGRRRADDAFSEESDANYIDDTRNKESSRNRGRHEQGSTRTGGSDQSSD